MKSSKKPSIISAVGILIAEITRNNPFVQERSLKHHPFELINTILNHEGDLKVEKAVLGVLSALVKGLFIKMKRLFIEIEGVSFLFLRLNKSLETAEKLNIKGVSGKTIPVLLDLLEFMQDIEGNEDVLMTAQDKFIQE